jgi:hypothetical protein
MASPGPLRQPGSEHQPRPAGDAARIGMPAAVPAAPPHPQLLRPPLNAESASVRAQAALLEHPRLPVAQRRSLAAEIGALHGNRHLGRVIAAVRAGPQMVASPDRQAGAVQERIEPGAIPEGTVQRRPITKAALESKYGITIAKGDKDWTAVEITDLNRALSRLSKTESAVLKGYHFVRWTNSEKRAAADPTGEPGKEEEAGLHQAELKRGRYRISLYDTSFEKGKVELDLGGKTIERPGGQWNILHELGHLMQNVDLRRAWAVYNPARSAHNKMVVKYNAVAGTHKALKNEYNALTDQYNAASAAEQKRLVRERAAMRKRLIALEKQAKALNKEVSTLEAKADTLEKKMDTAKVRALREFEKLAKGMKPVSEYAETSTIEAFAETYAMYKLNPKGIERINPKLGAWFKRQGYLLGGR